VTTRRQKADAVTSRLNTTAVCGRSGARLMRVIPQREPGGELYVRSGTCALLSDSLHNICPTGQNLGGRITLASPHYEFWGGRVPPSPPVFTPMPCRHRTSTAFQHTHMYETHRTIHVDHVHPLPFNIHMYENHRTIHVDHVHPLPFSIHRHETHRTILVDHVHPLPFNIHMYETHRTIHVDHVHPLSFNIHNV